MQKTLIISLITVVCVFNCIYNSAAGASESGKKASVIYRSATPDKIAAMTNIIELAALEAKINQRLKKMSMETFNALREFRETKYRLARQDKEIQAMSRKLADLQVAIDERIMEKYPQLKELKKKSNQQAGEYEKLRKELIQIKKRRQELDAAAQAGK